jgi:cardiolipin synthase
MIGTHGAATEPLLRCTEHPGAECVPWPTGGTDEYALFTEGDELYSAMICSIGAARDRVDLEAYIYAADEVGWRIGEALAAKARAGVRVRVLVDAAGSLFSFSHSLERYLQQQGVKVRRFHRWSWRRPLRFYRRNHRKLLAIDGREAYVGGFNLHRESSRSVYGPARWRDTHVRMSGGLAGHAAALFDAFWAGDHRWSPRSAQETGDALVPNHSRICGHQVHCLYTRLFHRAERWLFVTTPYFVPDHRTQNELVQAARRGVDVRLLLPGKSDVPIARWAARAAYRKLLSAGIRLFEYQPRVLHAKTAVVDGVVATVGTANLDYRSLFVNYELNLFSANRGLCGALKEQFLADLTGAVEVTAPGWSRRPWSGMVAESVGWMARRWL